MQAILIFPLALLWMNAMRKNMGLKVVNMKRIWLRDNYTNFHDSFIAEHADNVRELCSIMTTPRDAKETLRFNESHAAQPLQREVNKSRGGEGQAAVLKPRSTLKLESPEARPVTSYCCRSLHTNTFCDAA